MRKMLKGLAFVALMLTTAAAPEPFIDPGWPPGLCPGGGCTNLVNAYWNYVGTRRCYEARLGYLVVFINDVEMMRAKDAIAAIEAAELKRHPGLDTDYLWAAANKRYAPWYDQIFCRGAYSLLMQKAPPAPPIPKDFGATAGR